MLTSADIKYKAKTLGFDLCGVAPADDFPELTFLQSWLDQGYAGTMHYMTRTAQRRANVKHVLQGVETVISLGMVYNVNRPYSTEIADPNQADVSRYAWGEDYHRVIGERTDALLEWMRQAADQPFHARAYIDTGPVQERVYAQKAGLGWIGKNTCLINDELGSWIFLSEILCSLRLETDVPAYDQCGTCNLCLEACPTGAIVEPWVLDATRCISYLTIELKEAIPEKLREIIGTHVYGCDVCQDVCPWNANAAQSQESAWQPSALLDQPRLVELWRQPDEVLQPVIERSAMARAGLRGLRRNVAVALGNSATPEASAALTHEQSTGSRTDPLVKEHILWAVKQCKRIGGGELD